MTEPAKQIFVVDDNADFRGLLLDFLGSLGYQVQGFRTAREALKALELPPAEAAMPKLIISDINMPGMNGMELLTNLKKDVPQIPVILTSAYAGDEVAKTAATAGAFGFLAKPFGLSQMGMMVRRAVASHLGQ